MPKAIVQLITNFTVRDGLFLLAALITLLLSLRDGRIQVNVVPLWRIAIQRDVTRVRGKGDDRQITPLPGPLVSDLDGDGLNEIIVVDYRCRLSLFRVRNGVLLAEKVIQASEPVVKNSGRPVALGTGYLKPYPNHSSEPHKNVVVLVRDDWLVRCYDSELSKLIWERHTHHMDHVNRDRASLYMVYEATVTISPLENNTHVLPMERTLHKNDGIVLVGGSVHLRDDIASVGKSEEQLKEDERLARKFTIFALTGSTGDQLWEEEVDHNNIEEKQGNDEEVWKNETIHEYNDDVRSPQYKFPQGINFEKSSLENKTWHAFKASALENLPYSWSSPIDTRLDVVKLELQKKRSGIQRRQSWSSKRSQTTTQSPFSVSVVPTSAQLNHAYKPQPDVVMAHTSSGVTAVNLFTGAKLFSLPLSPNSGASGGQNGPSVWSDINGDDVIEHIKVAEKNSNPKDDDHEVNDVNSSNLPACYTLVTSGIPARHVFSGSICDRREAEVLKHNKSRKSTRINRRRKTNPEIKSATPLLVTKKSSYYSRTEGGYERIVSDVIFATNLGIITSYSHGGLINWQIKSGPTWTLSSNGYLSLLPLQSHDAAILALGDTDIMIYDRHGKLIGKGAVSQPPIKPPIIADIDGDGIEDIVVVSSDEIVFYKLSIELGSQYLVSCIIILSMGIIFAHIIGRGGIVAGKKRQRATD